MQHKRFDSLTLGSSRNDQYRLGFSSSSLMETCVWMNIHTVFAFNFSVNQICCEFLTDSADASADGPLFTLRVASNAADLSRHNNSHIIPL